MSGETIELLGDAGATSTARREEDTPPGHQEAGDEADSEPLSPDQVKLRRSLARRIASYKKVFPAEISELGSELDGLMYKSPEELATLLEEVQFLVETRRSTAQARGLFVAGLSMGEAAGGYAGLRLQGLTATAASSEEILRTVDECALKYEGTVAPLDPALRLAMAVGQLVLAVDASNRARESQPTPAPIEVKTPAPVAPVAPTNINAREEYRDL
jgi:hypothetical protein